MYAQKRKLSSSSSQSDRRKSDSDLQDNSRASRKPPSTLLAKNFSPNAPRHSQSTNNLRRDERIQNENRYIHPSEKKLTEKEINTIYSKFEAKKRSDKMKEIVWGEHLDRIAEVCKKHKYTIAIRETGALSIKRIEEGAKAKPHNILEKSIKKSSVNREYDTNADEVLAKLKEWDLDGFVGHWGANH